MLLWRSDLLVDYVCSGVSIDYFKGLLQHSRKLLWYGTFILQPCNTSKKCVKVFNSESKVVIIDSSEQGKNTALEV